MGERLSCELHRLRQDWNESFETERGTRFIHPGSLSKTAGYVKGIIPPNGEVLRIGRAPFR
jgi:hypothetical protein